MYFIQFPLGVVSIQHSNILVYSSEGFSPLAGGLEEQYPPLVGIPVFQSLCATVEIHCTPGIGKVNVTR